MDFMPRRPRIDKDGKVILKADGEPEMTRGTERLLIGSNGSILPYFRSLSYIYSTNRLARNV